MNQNEYLNDPDYLFALLVALVKRNGGKIKLSEEELDIVTKNDLMGMYWDPKNNEIVLKILSPEDVMRRPMNKASKDDYDN
tara:strand:+ start:219 stop:461 length:243 start_codon:yes stop_codon:yes gene_type:complete